MKQLYKACIEHLKTKTIEKAKNGNLLDGKNIKTRNRHDILQHLANSAHSIASDPSKQSSHAQEWIRDGFVNRLDESQDDQIHRNLKGDISKKNKHYKFTTTLPETAGDRLKV